jgi:hypothetical protein
VIFALGSPCRLNSVSEVEARRLRRVEALHADFGRGLTPGKIPSAYALGYGMSPFGLEQKAFTED